MLPQAFEQSAVQLEFCRNHEIFEIDISIVVEIVGFLTGGVDVCAPISTGQSPRWIFLRKTSALRPLSL
jgi:hypothetical protein